MRPYQLILTLGLFFILISCSEQAIDQEAEAEKLMELSRDWAKTANETDDLDEIQKFWADDAILLFPGQSAIRGSKAIKNMLEETSGIPGFEINWEPKEAYVSQSGDLGYVIFHNYFTMPDSTGKLITTYNKGVEIWKKQDGTWKNAVDIYNSDPSITSIK